MTRVGPTRRGKARRNRQGDNPSVVRGARSTLLGAASRGETITYGTLMRKFDLSRGKALSRMISAVDRKEHASGAPGFAAIIVRKDTRCPGGGYFCDDTLPPRLRRPGSRASDPRLSEAERSHIKRRQREIWAYYAEANSSTRRRNRLPRAGRLRVGRSGV